MNCNCDNLDAYLSGDLAPQDATHFAEHVQVCTNCRAEVEQQQWIDGLLQAANIEVVEAPPVALLESLRSVAIQPRRKRRIIACGLAAAAMLMVALGWIALTRHAAERAIAGMEKTKQKPATQSAFVADSHSIAVPVASQHPNVTVVRVYQTIQLHPATPASFEHEPGTYNNNISNPNLYGG
jgi:anti-sigma factor RsiW